MDDLHSWNQYLLKKSLTLRRALSVIVLVELTLMLVIILFSAVMDHDNINNSNNLKRILDLLFTIVGSINIVVGAILTSIGIFTKSKARQIGVALLISGCIFLLISFLVFGLVYDN